MRKKILIIGAILILITGCNKDNIEQPNDNISNDVKEINDNNETDTKGDVTKITLGENEYIRIEDNSVHKYTFTYPDKDTCVKNGDNEPYEILYPIRPYVTFGCEEIKDAEGNILWGEFFYEEAGEEYIFYY